MANQTATIDSIPLQGAGAFAGRTLTMTASCELMHNQLPASAIDPTRDLLVVQDSSGSPMVFSIGSDQTLRLLTHDPATPGGWKSVTLGVASAGSTALAFDVTQDSKGRISLAAAFGRKDLTGFDVLYATLIADTPNTVDWTTFPAFAKVVTGLDPTFKPTRVLLGSSDDGTAPLLTIVGVLNAQQHYYLLQAPGQAAAKLDFPENFGSDPAALLDVAQGFAFGQRGVWFLYTNGASQTLECTTFKTTDQGAMTYDYSPGYKDIPSAMRYTCIATPTGASLDPFSISSDVYVGTSTGIYVFNAAHAANPATVAQGLKDVRQIVVRTKGDLISVWAMSSPSELWYIAGKHSQPGIWNAPVLFSSDCIHVAPIRNGTTGANELFTVTGDLSLQHAVQDATSTLWHQSVIRTPKTNFLLNTTTYTSLLHFDDEHGSPLTGFPVSLTTSDRVYATVNGRMVSLDLDASEELTTDTSGNITVIVPASDISTPILHLASNALNPIINIYPNARVQNGLSQVKTGADLKAAQAAGKPVLDPATTDDIANGTASNISQMADAGAQGLEGQKVAGATYVTLSDSKHTGVLKASLIPHGVVVGMTLQGGVWQPHPQPGAQPHRMLAGSPIVGSVLDSIAMGVGDALHWLEHQFEDGLKALQNGITTLADGASFLLHKVEDGLQLVLTLAGKVLTIALKTFGAVLKALNFVLKLVGIDLGKILAWLGHLLGWDVIWNTHKTLAAMIKNGLDYAESKADAEIANLQTTVHTALSGLKAQFAALVLPASVASGSPHAVYAAAGTGPKPDRSAPASMASYQVQHGGMLNGTSAALAGGVTLDSFATSFLPTLLNTIFTDLERLAGDFAKIMTDPASTLDSIRKGLVDLLDLVLDPIQQIIDEIFGLVREAMTAIKGALTNPVDIPFLGALYEFITDLLGDGEQFTVVNAVALLLAIPIVEMSRAAGKGDPFDGVSGFDRPELFSQLSRQAVVHAASPVVRAAAAPANGVVLRAAAVATPVPRVLAAAPDQGLTDQQRGYMVWGGLIGSISSFFENLLTPFSSGDDSPIDAAVLVMSLLRASVTFPLQDGTYDVSAYALKTTAWCVATGTSLVTLLLKATVKLEGKVEGGISAVSNTVLLSMLLGANGEAKEDNPLQWMTDSFSGGGGVVMGLGSATGNGEVTLGGVVLGCLGSMSGFMLSVMAGEDLVHLVNVGG